MSGAFIERFSAKQDYAIAPNALVIDTIDMHTGGEPLRVITGGYPQIQANSLLDYRRRLKDEFDHLRTAIMFEPRGHADMYGVLVLAPFNPKADCSVIFMHNEGYSTMCGHAVIAIMTLAMQMDWVDVTDDKATMTIEAPCGLIEAQGHIENGQIQASFECVPSFVGALNQQVYIASLKQSITYDLAYGGAFYAYVDITKIGVAKMDVAVHDISLTPDNHSYLAKLGDEIKQAVIAQSQSEEHPLKIEHPFEADLSFLYGTIFYGPAIDGEQHADSRNVCIFADKEVDRSPTGSGVSGRMALHYAKGELALGESMKIQSIIGSTFAGQAQRCIDYGPTNKVIKAVIPKVSGDAKVCGINRLILDPSDKLSNGFLLK